MKPARSIPRGIPTINGASSSIKFALFKAGDSLQRILEGGIERIGLPETAFIIKGSENVLLNLPEPNHTTAVWDYAVASGLGNDRVMTSAYRIVELKPPVLLSRRVQ